MEHVIGAITRSAGPNNLRKDIYAGICLDRGYETRIKLTEDLPFVRRCPCGTECLIRELVREWPRRRVDSSMPMIGKAIRRSK